MRIARMVRNPALRVDLYRVLAITNSVLIELYQMSNKGRSLGSAIGSYDKGAPGYSRNGISAYTRYAAHSNPKLRALIPRARKAIEEATAKLETETDIERRRKLHITIASKQGIIDRVTSEQERENDNDQA
jgi:hypothetical protein